jgi:phosphate-selective porin OprO/OprP
VGLGLVWSLSSPARADDTPAAASAASPTTGAATQNLDARVDALERRLALLSPVSGTSAAFQGSPASAFASVDRGIGFISSDGNYGIQFGGTLQEDSRNYIYDGLNTYNNGKDYVQPQANELVLARARLLVDAFLGPRVHVRYQEDFSNNGANTGSSALPAPDGAELVDAYGELRLLPWTLLRVGQFKTGLDIERWRQTPAEDFIQYSYTAGLTIDRDQGAEIEIADPRQILYLSAGAFDGDTDTGSNPVEQSYNSDKDAIVRLFIQPFNGRSGRALGDLGAGVSASGGNHTGDPEQSFKSIGQLSMVNAGSGNVLSTYTEGAGYRVIPQAYWFWRNLSLLGEYVHESDGYRVASTLQDGTVDSEAWTAQAGWVLTGEHTSYTGLKLDDRSHPWGALELVGRVQGEEFDEGAFTDYGYKNGVISSVNSRGYVDPAYSVESLSSWSLGLNYVPVRDVEFLVDWDQTVFTDGGQDDVFSAGKVVGTEVANRPTEQALEGRVQFAF